MDDFYSEMKDTLDEVSTKNPTSSLLYQDFHDLKPSSSSSSYSILPTADALAPMIIPLNPRR